MIVASGGQIVAVDAKSPTHDGTHPLTSRTTSTASSTSIGTGFPGCGVRATPPSRCTNTPSAPATTVRRRTSRIIAGTTSRPPPSDVLIVVVVSSLVRAGHQDPTSTGGSAPATTTTVEVRGVACSDGRREEFLATVVIAGWIFLVVRRRGRGSILGRRRGGRGGPTASAASPRGAVVFVRVGASPSCADGGIGPPHCCSCRRRCYDHQPLSLRLGNRWLLLVLGAGEKSANSSGMPEYSGRRTSTSTGRSQQPSSQQ